MTSLHPGDQLDHYRIDSLVARSGMASIFRATDTRTGVAVAVKVPHSEAECDVAFYERFQREARIGCEMDHPGVIRVFEVEKPSRLYMVQEWVDGRLLREILAREGKLEPPRAVRIALDLCSVLEHIHDRGVVHRDLKPENIIVGPADRIKLIDFGIAGKAGARRLTFGKLSHIMGTAEYIAPEQVKGKRGDARSDLYALGIILFEMLTGTTPFRGENPFAVMNARLKSDPAPLREVDPRLPAGLEAILQRLLQRDPGDRYASARDLAQDLAQPRQVVVMHRRQQPEPLSSRIWFYSRLAAIPVTIFLLLLLAAHNQ